MVQQLAAELVERSNRDKIQYLRNQLLSKQNQVEITDIESDQFDMVGPLVLGGYLAYRAVVVRVIQSLGARAAENGVSLLSTALKIFALSGTTFYFTIWPNPMGDGSLTGAICSSPEFFVQSYLLQFSAEEQEQWLDQDCVQAVVNENYLLLRSQEIYQDL
jgi:hypothetical protein